MQKKWKSLFLGFRTLTGLECILSLLIYGNGNKEEKRREWGDNGMGSGRAAYRGSERF